MAVRKKLAHDMKTREKIRTSQLINRLTDHIHGKVELSNTQVRGIEILLKKTLPDLSAVDHTGEVTVTNARELTDAELSNIATAGSAGTTQSQDSSQEPDKIH